MWVMLSKSLHAAKHGINYQLDFIVVHKLNVMLYDFFFWQCCALSFIEKLDAQALSMSQEEFNRWVMHTAYQIWFTPEDTCKHILFIELYLWMVKVMRETFVCVHPEKWRNSPEMQPLTFSVAFCHNIIMHLVPW